MPTPEPGTKYVAGWLTLRDGVAEDFDRILADYVATCRAEPECRFFEMMRTREDPGTVFLCESFESEEAHAIHLARPHVRAFFEIIPNYVISGRFENVIAAKVSPDSATFGR
jgi:quinol monooxygenase YgiN